MEFHMVSTSPTLPANQGDPSRYRQISPAGVADHPWNTPFPGCAEGRGRWHPLTAALTAGWYATLELT